MPDKEDLSDAIETKPKRVKSKEEIAEQMKRMRDVRDANKKKKIEDVMKKSAEGLEQVKEKPPKKIIREIRPADIPAPPIEAPKKASKSNKKSAPAPEPEIEDSSSEEEQIIIKKTKKEKPKKKPRVIYIEESSDEEPVIQKTKKKAPKTETPDRDSEQPARFQIQPPQSIRFF